jgi:hypothetical protein
MRNAGVSNEHSARAFFVNQRADPPREATVFAIGDARAFFVHQRADPPREAAVFAVGDAASREAATHVTFAFPPDTHSHAFAVDCAGRLTTACRRRAPEPAAPGSTELVLQRWEAPPRAATTAKRRFRVAPAGGGDGGGDGHDTKERAAIELRATKVLRTATAADIYSPHAIVAPHADGSWCYVARLDRDHVPFSLRWIDRDRVSFALLSLDWEPLAFGGGSMRCVWRSPRSFPEALALPPNLAVRVRAMARCTAFPHAMLWLIAAYE